MGDHISAVNGQSIIELSHDSIVQLIKDAGVTVTLTVIAEEGKDPGDLPSPRRSAGHHQLRCGRSSGGTVYVLSFCLFHLMNLKDNLLQSCQELKKNNPIREWYLCAGEANTQT